MAETDRRTRVMSRALPRVTQRFVSDERLVALVRRGDRGAFESLYDRHVAELLSFCFFMLASREDAEDAVQSTFASAYRALLRDTRGVDVRPWLFAIARNACIGILRKRRSQVLEQTEQAARPAYEDVLDKVERRESVRQLLSGMLELPERHRSALVLAELHGQSQSEIGELLGVPPSTVKSYIFQARATLTSERAARETDCHEIRAELVTARGAGLLRGRLRRHLRSCAGCRQYAHDVSHRRRELGALLPLLPTFALKRRVLDAAAGQATGVGACVGGAGAGVTLSGAIELGGAGAKTLLAKVLIAATGLGAGASAGTLVLGVASSQPVGPGARAALAADSTRGQSVRASNGGSSAVAPGPAGAGLPLAGSSAPVGEPGAGRVKGAGAGGAGAGQAGHARAVAGGAGGGHGNGGAGGNGYGNVHGAKAAGSSAEHGNSAAAHAGAKGKSAEHGHSAGHGNSASHGNSGGPGKSQGHGNAGGKGNSAGRGTSAGGGNGRSVGRTNSAAIPGAAAHGNAAGHGHGAEPAAQPRAAAVQGHGASPGASAGQANGDAPSPGQPAAGEEGANAPSGEAKPSPGPAGEHGAPGAGGPEPPGHGAPHA